MLAAVASFDGDGVLRFKRQVEAGLMADGHWLVGAAVGLLASRRVIIIVVSVVMVLVHFWCGRH